ncbi:MAG: M20/M25/M40 family metallo-hydrolase [Kofleriaceae bacterium]
MWWLIVVGLVACGSPPPPLAVPPPLPAIDAAPPRDPMAEASLVEDLAWLTHKDRAGRGSYTGDARATAQWLVEQLAAAGAKPALLPIPAIANQSNVVAAFGPATGKAMLVTAHYDHLGVIGGRMHPGADDNASGVVVALAVARELGAHPPAGRIVFVFTGAEEAGLAGAKAYVAAPTVPLAEIRAVFNLDMVGRNFFASSLNQEARVASVGITDDTAIFEAATTAATAAGLELLPVRPGFLTLIGEANRSDDWVFREAGVFAVHLSTGLNDDYHQPSDTADKISRPQLVRMARLLLALTARIPSL